MEVIGRVGIQITQFQIREREDSAVLVNRSKDTGIGAIAGCTGQFVSVLHIHKAVLLRSVYGNGRNTTVKNQLHFCFDVIGAPK